MLYIYPSNRLEDLAQLLAGVIRLKPNSPLCATTILVPNPGMQHWLSLSLSKTLGVAMNLSCPLPTRFLWDVCRQILGEDKIPKQSPYKREVLVWRIFELLQSSIFSESAIADDIQFLWQTENASQPTQKALKQYEFALQLADVFEQYLVFRSDWLNLWEQNKTVGFDHPNQQKLERWQAWFWQNLVALQPLHPGNLQQAAIEKLKEGKVALPQDIYIFAINTISPTYLAFFDALSQHTNLHFFHLNPCVNYWGDAKSDLAIAKIKRIQAYENSLDEQLLHPLLRNLGHQGRELINLMSGLEHHEIAAFEELPSDEAVSLQASKKLSLLERVQIDILKGQATPEALSFDNSISIHACHSHVRELHVLKDNLLHLFASNPDLQPKDVVVMCPSIESYSPYILSIFTQSQESTLNIPVSISDRRPIESEPLIMGFLALLKMPYGRFDSTSLINLMTTPAMAAKFNMSATEISTCALWLKDACVHWGIDDEHVQSHLSGATKGFIQTWEKGLERLLLGLINANSDQFIADITPVSYIEGQQTVILGKFLLMVETILLELPFLLSPKPIAAWSDKLSLLYNTFFIPTDSDKLAAKLLTEAIKNLGLNAEMAASNSAIDGRLIAETLESLLNIPEARSQFHSGNVTFCSMLPMRSIPFKVIAILGLNQSDFPRQDIPFSINLMANSKTKIGDRSRRGDDRYLFLESLISARKHLHLSYQYRAVKDNSARQASLVLKMLIDYCHQSYSDESLPIIEHGLHPFSAENYQNTNRFAGSYEPAWWRHYAYLQQSVKSGKALNNKMIIDFSPIVVKQTNESGSEKAPGYDLHSVTRFLKNPSAYFAQEKLNVYFKKEEARDFEVSYEFSKLQEAIFKQELFTQLIKRDESTNSSPNQLASENPQDAIAEPLGATLQKQLKTWLNSANLPYLINAEQSLTYLQQQTLALYKAYTDFKMVQRLKGELELEGLRLIYDFKYHPDIGVRAIKFTDGKPTLRHLIMPYLEYLILLVVRSSEDPEKEGGTPNFGILYPPKHDAKKASDETIQVACEEFCISDESTAYDCLVNITKVFLKGQNTPVFLDLNLAEDVLKNHSIETALADVSLQSKWREAADPKTGIAALISSLPDPYFDYLFGSMPRMDEAHLHPFFACFGSLIKQENQPQEDNNVTEELNRTSQVGHND